MSDKKHDGSGPYLRAEVTIAMAIVTKDDQILHGDMLDTTLAFGRGIADGDAIDAGLVTSEHVRAMLAPQAANLAQAVRVLVEQQLAYLGPVENGRGMLDDIVETGPTFVEPGVAIVQRIDGKGARA